MKKPRAQWREYGQEYCGVLYSLGEGIYYASFPSSLGEPERTGVKERKTCYSPRQVVDTRGRPSPVADYHSHPWAFSPMSDEDRLVKNQRWLIRIQFDTTCTVQKLIPYANDERPGELYERQGKRWRLIGYIMPQDKASGRITPIESIQQPARVQEAP
jgi:hypothetical protein